MKSRRNMGAHRALQGKVSSIDIEGSTSGNEGRGNERGKGEEMGERKAEGQGSGGRKR